MDINLESKVEIKKWIDSQQWYQTIELSNGLITPGRFDSLKRLKKLADENIHGKSVLDVGCNSGCYCLWAKKQGASRVVGVDIDDHRLKQARTLAEIEKVDVEYQLKSISDLKSLGHFDVVFCFAVLTEIKDLLGAVEALRTVIGQKAYIEIALAKPLLYISRSRHWLKSLFQKGRIDNVCEIRDTKIGPIISPSMRMFKKLLGDEFSVISHGRGLRYDAIIIERISN